LKCNHLTLLGLKGLKRGLTVMGELDRELSLMVPPFEDNLIISLIWCDDLNL